jgi:sarcosine oxidase subunit beta
MRWKAMSKNIADVIIVGAGIAGNSAAYYCAKKGLKVIVLEEEMIGNGGSSRNGGGARVSGRDLREMPLAIYATQKIWPNLKDELGVDPEYRRKGYLVCGYNDTHKEGIKKRIKDAAKSGIEMFLIEGDDLKKINPYLSEHVTCAGWTPTDGVANPLTATLGFYKRARELGVRFITGEKAVKINLYKGVARQVVTERGNIYEGGKIIVSAGYGGRSLINTVGLDLPLFKRLIEVIVTEPMPVMFHHMIGGMSGFYGHQTDHGSFVFGDSTGRENCMAEVGGILSTSYNPSNICSHIGEDIPALKTAKIIRSWSGWVDMSNDGVPVIGNVPEVPNLVLDIGATGHGFCPGPAVGYTLAQLANNEKPDVDISKLAYERFDYAKKQPKYYFN